MAVINLSKLNYFHNLSLIEKRVKDKNKIAVVLKDNAYGHGLYEVASMAKEFGIKKAVVKNISEAIVIESLFDEILILSDTNIKTYSPAFHIAINELDAIERIPKNSKVHLKIDSGMHRNGIRKDDIEEAIYRLLRQNLILTGCFSHHRSADALSCEFFCQKSDFNESKKKIQSLCEKLNLSLPMFHIHNSAALFRENSFDEDDIVRAGIATYGYINLHLCYGTPELKPVLSLYANRISSRWIKKNQRIGYGGTFQAKKNMCIGTYDIGYGDGFFRIDGNQEYTTPLNYRVLGRVSMDSLSLDTDDEMVCLFDNATQLAKLHNTIEYEILTALKSGIPRQII